MVLTDSVISVGRKRSSVNMMHPSLVPRPSFSAALDVIPRAGDLNYIQRCGKGGSGHETRCIKNITINIILEGILIYFGIITMEILGAVQYNSYTLYNNRRIANSHTLHVYIAVF